MSMFKKATKSQAKLRMALVGPAGSGKTYTALRVGRALVGPQGKIAVLDSEHGSASKYASEFEFDVVEPDSFSPLVYINTIKEAEKAGYDLLVMDSLSHAWIGKDGALEMVDSAKARNQGNSFAGWRDVTPLHNKMIDTMLSCKIHLIVTMRSKTEWVIEENEKGKKAPRKIGLQPVQRDGLEYEMDIVGDLDQENRYVISKTRCSQLAGKVFYKPGDDLGEIIKAWLSDGQPVVEPVMVTPSESAATQEQIAELRKYAVTLKWNRESAVKWLTENYNVDRIESLTQWQAEEAESKLVDLLEVAGRDE